MVEFRWNEWNLDHATRHGVSVEEIQGVVNRASRPWPRRLDRDKWIVEGRGRGDRPIRVIYLLSRHNAAYVIHAMPLTTRRRH